MVIENKSTHIIELCKELLDDIELSRISSEAILLKATRLARLSGSDEIGQFLRYEWYGYDMEPLSIEYMAKTGRYINEIDNDYYKASLKTIEEITDSNKELYDMELKKVLNGQSNQHTLNTIKDLQLEIGRLNNIHNSVIRLIHFFVSNAYYEKLFSGYSESIFEKYKESIDLLLTDQCCEVIEKIPSIFERLSNGESEAVSHALTTCRRIIDFFADAVYPPSKEGIEIGGNILDLGADKYQNRINAYISENTSSTSRKDKLRSSLKHLYKRLNAGVHSDVSIDEAKALFLEVYLFLGEVLSLENKGD